MVLPMKAWKNNRIAWSVCALLAGVVLIGVGVLGLRLRPYYVAIVAGRGANLRRTSLRFAPLRRADLCSANLRRAGLPGASLRKANLKRTDLRYANLADANLRGAILVGANLTGANLTGARMKGARYDARTHWFPGFDPKQHGVVRVR
jgi:hypothetical protein